MTVHKLAALAAAALLAAGCASTYQPHGFSGGYSDSQLDANVFRVSFRGNGYTTPERAEDMATLRAAELTLRHGFTHFAILEKRYDVEHSSFTAPAQTQTRGTVSSYGGTSYLNARSVTSGGYTFTSSDPRVSTVIECFNGKPREGSAFDARFVYDSLTKKYDIARSL